jgi:hypothetical protein
MNLSAIIRGVLLVVVVAIVAGGVLIWRGILHLPVRTASAPRPGPTKSATPFAPPVGAPKFDPLQNKEADAIDPFVVRLAKVNKMARKQIVTFAEYEDTDGGQRYFLAIVTSCKDLNALWPINKGVLQEKVEGPLQLKDDFSIFSFAEYYQNGQWGVQSCDGTT